MRNRSDLSEIGGTESYERCESEKKGGGGVKNERRVSSAPKSDRSASLFFSFRFSLIVVLLFCPIRCLVGSDAFSLCSQDASRPPIAVRQSRTVSATLPN